MTHHFNRRHTLVCAYDAVNAVVSRIEQKLGGKVLRIVCENAGLQLARIFYQPLTETRKEERKDTPQWTNGN
jgi:hypothetical protein